MHLHPVSTYPETSVDGALLTNLFWSGEQRRPIRLGSFLYDTSSELGGIRMLRRGSVLQTVEKEEDIIEDRQVIAGCRSVTKGTLNLAFGLNCPESMPTLSLLAMEARWNLMGFSW